MKHEQSSVKPPLFPQSDKKTSTLEKTQVDVVMAAGGVDSSMLD